MTEATDEAFLAALKTSLDGLAELSQNDAWWKTVFSQANRKPLEYKQFLMKFAEVMEKNKEYAVRALVMAQFRGTKLSSWEKNQTPEVQEELRAIWETFAFSAGDRVPANALTVMRLVRCSNLVGLKVLYLAHSKEPGLSTLFGSPALPGTIPRDMSAQDLLDALTVHCVLMETRTRAVEPAFIRDWDKFKSSCVMTTVLLLCLPVPDKKKKEVWLEFNPKHSLLTRNQRQELVVTQEFLALRSALKRRDTPTWENYRSLLEDKVPFIAPPAQAP